MSQELKCSDEVVKTLRTERNNIRLMQAKVKKAQGDFEVSVSEALMGAGAQIEDSTLCLDCGTIRAINIPICSVCDKAARVAQAAQPA